MLYANGYAPSIPRQGTLRDHCVIVGVADVSTTIVFDSFSSVKDFLKKICVGSVPYPVRVRETPMGACSHRGKIQIIRRTCCSILRGTVRSCENRSP